MKARHLALTCLFSTALILASAAHADKLCLKVSFAKKTGKVSAEKQVAAACPKGYLELTDTSSFVGPAGPAGAAGTNGRSVGDRSCAQRSNNFTCVISDTNRLCTPPNFQCNSGEYLLMAVSQGTETYSADYNEIYTGGGFFNANAGKTLTNPPFDFNNYLFDANRKYRIGVSPFPRDFTYASQIVGTATYSHDYHLTCCLLDN